MERHADFTQAVETLCLQYSMASNGVAHYLALLIENEILPLPLKLRTTRAVAVHVGHHLHVGNHLHYTRHA